MKESVKKKAAVLTVLVLVAGSIPVQTTVTSEAATKAYTISKGTGIYKTAIQTRIKVKKGYKVYYTTNGTFTTKKVIKSGKTKTFTVKKSTNLEVIAVKKTAKATKKKLNKTWKSKIKTYEITIEKNSSTTPATSTDTPTETMPVIEFPSESPGATPTGTPTATTAPVNISGLGAIASDTTKPAALTYSTASAQTITMKAASNYTSAEEGSGYKIEASDNSTVLTISSSGTYIVSTDGTISGQIINKATDGEVKLVLNGVNLTNALDGDEGAILGKKSSSPLTIILASGKTNTITTTGAGETVTEDDGTTDTDYPACILVKKASSLTIGGTGTLNLTSTNGSGIKVKYNDTEGDISTSSATDSKFWETTLTIQDSPTINITCNAADEAAYQKNNYNTDSYDAHQDAISSKNSLAIYGGTLNLAAGDDGIHAEALSHIVGGTINVTSSTEALEGARVVIDGGTLDLKAYDDGINAANGDITSDTNGEDVSIFNITINAGTISVNSEGDGIDSNGNAFITGGTVRVYGPSQGGNGALDVADRGALLVTGGELVATAASSDMAVVPSSGGCASVVFTTNSISSGQTLTVKDSSGSTVGSLTTVKTTGWILYCSASVKENESYTLYNGSNQVATATAGYQSGAMGPGGMPGGTMPGGTMPGGTMPGGPGGAGAPPTGING